MAGSALLNICYSYSNSKVKSAVKEDGEYKEIDLYGIWNTIFYRSMPLKTLSGSRIKVLVPGEKNKFSGPDFRNAIIEINGSPFRGDVEIHRRMKDWYWHGHHLDKNYDKVVLHVVVENDDDCEYVRTSKGKFIETVAIRDVLGSSELPTSGGQENFVSIPACINRVCFDIHSLLTALSQERLFSRIDKIGIRARFASLDQVVYEQLFWSLGAGTRFADIYLNLARRVPYTLACEISQREPQSLEKVYLRELRCLRSNSMKELCSNRFKGKEDFIDGRLENVIESYSDYNGHQYLNSAYPASLPSKRVLFMTLLINSLKVSLVEHILECLRNSLLHKRPWLYWQNIFNSSKVTYEILDVDMKVDKYRDDKKGKSGSLIIGSQKVISILGNVILPFAFYCYYEGILGVKEEELWRFYFTLPGEADNWILRKMKRIKEVVVPNRSLKFFEQQGLIQWYWHNCAHHPNCKGCQWNLSEE